MKNSALLVLALLLVSGVVFGQTTAVPTTPPAAIPNASKGLFGWYSAVGTSSTESRYSAGRFGSLVDDYIDVTWKDPEVGTFFFAGGFPGTDAGVDTSGNFNPVDQNGDPRPGYNYVANFGLGKTLSNGYLGIYYAGNLVNALGSDDGEGNRGTSSAGAWRNKLALLYSSASMGAIRLDLIVDTDTASDTYGALEEGTATTSAPSIAVTYGGIQLAGMDFYATLAFKFADRTLTTAEPEGKKPTTTLSGALLGVQAGIYKSLNETSDVSADLAIKADFGDASSGESKHTAEGSFTMGIKGGYGKTIEVGKLAFKVKPNAVMAFQIDGQGEMEPEVKAPTNNLFELGAGIDAGLRFQATEKVALYTGASYTLFNWRVFGHSPSKGEENKTSSWEFSGIDYNTGNFLNNSYLGLGMTVTPIENLVIGAGISSFLNNLFTLDLQTMQLSTAAAKWGTNSGSSLGYIGQFFSGLTFDLTVSYKF